MDLDYTFPNLRAWCQGKPPLLCAVAREIVSSIDMIYELSLRRKRGLHLGTPTNIDLAPWLKLYKSKRRLAIVSCSRAYQDEPYTSLLSDAAEEAQDFLLFLRQNRTQIAREFEKIRQNPQLAAEFRREMDEWIRESLPKIQQEWRNFEDAHLKDIGQFVFKSKTQKVDVQKPCDMDEFFIVNIWIACWSIYGCYPTSLLRKARLGKLEAMEKLLRLDSMLQYDKGLSRIIHRAYLHDPATYKDIARWAAEGPKQKLSKRALKVHFGALLSKMSLELAATVKIPPLTAPQIQGLFDAYAKDIGLGEIDPDLAEYSPEAFYKALQRARSIWMILHGQIITREMSG